MLLTDYSHLLATNHLVSSPTCYLPTTLTVPKVHRRHLDGHRSDHRLHPARLRRRLLRAPSRGAQGAGTLPLALALALALALPLALALALALALTLDLTLNPRPRPSPNPTSHPNPIPNL